MTSRSWSYLSEVQMVEKLNRVLSGWANYSCMGLLHLKWDPSRLPHAHT